MKALAAAALLAALMLLIIGTSRWWLHPRSPGARNALWVLSGILAVVVLLLWVT